MKIEENRIVYEQDNQEIGEIEFKEVKPGVVDVYHTYVDPDYQGQHIASKLVEELFKKLIKENKLIIPSCSYVDYWVKKHPEYQANIYKQQ